MSLGSGSRPQLFSDGPITTPEPLTADNLMARNN